MTYNRDLLSIIDSFRAWTEAGTIQKMQVGMDTNLTIRAGDSKAYFAYTSGTQTYKGELKLPKKINSQSS